MLGWDCKMGNILAYIKVVVTTDFYRTNILIVSIAKTEKFRIQNDFYKCFIATNLLQKYTYCKNIQQRGKCGQPIL